MNIALKDRFLSLWKKYFGEAEWPIAFEYADEDRGAEPAVASAESRCMIGALREVREGRSLAFTANSYGCAGGAYYCGFRERLRSNIAEFLSCGIEGELEGERYKKTPEIAAAALKQVPRRQAPASHLVFKRWDRLQHEDNPEVVIFFASPDVLSGLFTLAGYDESALDAVIAPFGSGCSSLISYPCREGSSDHPRAVLGMLDVSARSYFNADELSFAVPLKKFERMVANMEESFLITESWAEVRKRILNRR